MTLEGLVEVAELLPSFHGCYIGEDGEVESDALFELHFNFLFVQGHHY